MGGPDLREVNGTMTMQNDEDRPRCRAWHRREHHVDIGESWLPDTRCLGDDVIMITVETAPIPTPCTFCDGLGRVAIATFGAWSVDHEAVDEGDRRDASCRAGCV